MSGQKRLDKLTRNIRVVAMPSKVRENEDGTKTQLYKVRPMRWPKKGQGAMAQSRMAQYNSSQSHLTASPLFPDSLTIKT